MRMLSRFLIAALIAFPLVNPSVASADDLPAFPGDGRNTDAPVLSAAFSKAKEFPSEIFRNEADRSSLSDVLVTQAQVVGKAKPFQMSDVDGSSIQLNGDILASVVGALDKWRKGNGPLENYVDGYLLKGDGQGNVRFTGYFTPTIPVMDAPSSRFNVPLFRKPSGTVSPLPSSQEIYRGALDGQGLELAWTDSLIDLFILQVQGSGYGSYPDGTRKLFSFGGKNGHPYASIGKHLVALGEIPAAEISRSAIRAWMEKNPNRVREILEVNPSYVFFTTEVASVTGAAAVPVTPFRTVAADSTVLPLGAMLLIEMPILDAEGRVASYQPRIMAVQDRGGAIKGTDRVDIYAGAGEEAEKFVDGLKHFGRVWLLLPKS